MLVIRQSGQEALKLIQVRYEDGWYEDGVLVKSYAANGSSNTWNFVAPTKAVLAISGCGGGGGGGAGYNDGASAGAGGGGGGSAVAVQNLIIPVPAGEVIEIVVGYPGVGKIIGGADQSNGGETELSFTSIYPGEFDTRAGGTLGNFAKLQFRGGECGASAVTGATGFGRGGYGGYIWWNAKGLAVPGLTSGAEGVASTLSNPPYTRQAMGGGAGGNPGAAGGGTESHVGHCERLSVGGATADGAGGGGGGGVSILGPPSDGGAGHASAAALTWGWGSGGAGGGGNSAGNTNAGNGANGRPGYVEIIYMVTQ